MNDCLADTNIVLRWLLSEDAFHLLCRRVIRKLRQQGVRVASPRKC